MKQLKKKGEVFTVLPDGTVLRRVSSFRELFEEFPYTKEDWEVDYERWLKSAEDNINRARQLRAEAKIRRARRKDFLCRLCGAGVFILTLMAFI